MLRNAILAEMYAPFHIIHTQYNVLVKLMLCYIFASLLLFCIGACFFFPTCTVDIRSVK